MVCVGVTKPHLKLSLWLIIKPVPTAGITAGGQMALFLDALTVTTG